MYRFIFGFFLKLHKICGAPMKPSELLCFKDNKFYCVFFFLAAGNKKSQRGNATAIAFDANIHPTIG